MSLKGWDDAGILRRELRLFRELSARVGPIGFVTYGDRSDVGFVADVPGSFVLSNGGGLSANAYSVLAPWIHRQALRRASLFRTNQINGAWCAVIAKRLFKKPLVVRCGYLWSDFVARLSRNPIRRYVAAAIERYVFRTADQVMVATDADRTTVVARYGLDRSRVHLVPNYVDTALFRPMPEIHKSAGLVTFVGRLDPQKNPLALIEALQGLPNVRLQIVGDGPLRPQVMQRAAALGVSVDALGRVSHERLPALLNRSELFVLPSIYEGHPKALLEAMACAVPVAAARVPGVENLIVHRETGLLCGTTPSDLRDAIETLLNDETLRITLAQNGRRYVENECSLSKAVERELAVLEPMLAGVR